jgi:hypothetical protein
MMNAERLREAIDSLLQAESALNVQESLQTLQASLQQLSGNPNDPTSQTRFADELTSSRDVIQKLKERFTPVQMSLFHEIRATESFFLDFTEEVYRLTQENPMTPAVTLTRLNTLVGGREGYLALLRELQKDLQAIGIEASKLQPGEVEIGVLIPRDLFANHLEELVRETRSLNRFLRIFSEYETGAPEPVEIHQVSTSGLEFLLGISTKTIVTIGGVITWALHTWKQVEDIRKVRSETQKLPSFTKEEIEQFFETKITKAIEGAIDEKIKEIGAPARADKGRQQELQIELQWALNYALSHIERGMTVELRFLPPPAAAAAGSAEEAAPEQRNFQKLQEIAPQLRFPPPEPSPILPLPTPEPELPAAQRRDR